MSPTEPNLEQFDLDALHLRTGAKWNRHGPDVIPAWVADMDFPVAEPIRKIMVSAIENGNLGYPQKGTEQVASVFANRMASQHGWRPNPARIIPVIDVVQALYVSLMVYSEPGDGVLVQTPIYPPFLSAIRDNQREIVANPLTLSGSRYEIDFDHLRSVASQARVFMLCNPHNPCGRAFSRDELEQLAELACEHDWIVLADEIHSDLLFEGSEHIPFASLSPEVEARTVTFNACTKAFNVAGLRYALTAFGSEELQGRFGTIHSRVLGGANAFGAAVSCAAWEECSDWLAHTMTYLQRNRDLVINTVNTEMAGVRCANMEATYLAWLDCRELGLNTTPFNFFLEQGKVGLSDGADFGQEGEGFVRLNFATPRPVLEEILKRMQGALTSRT